MLSILVIANVSMMQFLAPSDVKIEDAFWSPKYRVWRGKTVGDVLDKLEKDKWFENFDHVAAGELGTGAHAGPHFANGLCYEALCGASDYLANESDPALEARLDGLIARIASAQAADPDGYLNTHNQLHHPQFRWGENGGCLLSQHELYNAGMLIEAGVHHYRATGKTTLLAVAARYANLLCDTIGSAPKHNRVPTHSGPEGAVLELARLARENPALADELGMNADAYTDLVVYWMNMRGHHCGQPAWEGGDLGAIIHEIAVRADELYDANDPQKRPSWGDYAMDRVPLDDYTSIEGHAVRATLLGAGIASLALETGDARWQTIATRLWESMVGRKMYITGGVGALSDMERFGPDYYLPSAAYLETCAAVGSAFFSGRLAELTGEGRYIDELERVLYNALLTAVGEKGTTYTYENPLESDHHRRWAWHNCPCCPPMFLKLTGALPGYIYSVGSDAVSVNLYIGSETTLPVGGQRVGLRLETDYPSGGVSTVTIGADASFALRLRIPGWAVGKENPFDLYTSSPSGDVALAVNGEAVPLVMDRGYAVLDRSWKAGDRVTLSLPTGERVIKPNPAIADLAGQTARARGPLVMAVENGRTIPYHAVANGRGESSFAVWNGDDLSVEVRGGEEDFLVFTANRVSTPLTIAAPVFEIENERVVAAADLRPVGGPKTLSNGVTETVYEGDIRSRSDARLRVVLRLASDSPVARFRYELLAKDERGFRLTKSSGHDALAYLRADVSHWSRMRKEIRFGEYDSPSHAYRPSEHVMNDRDFENAIAFQGPMCTFEGDDSTALLAYEHGSQAPCTFIEFACADDESVTIRATRGNYWTGRPVTPSDPFETIWLEAALVKGNEDVLAKRYRDFQLKRCTLNAGSRTPYIFYNTWASQERDKWWDHSGDFMNLMNEKRILEDIDIAHEMGVDVFVVDVSWFRQTGDWIVDEQRFPRGLGVVREKLRGYGMKMGLWFNPTEAAQVSDMMARNKKSVMSYDGVESPVHSVWQTPGSQNICVVSDYWKDFADRLIEIAKELDIIYFKWDGISQFGCNSPDHHHGDASTTGEERHECYSFEQVRYLCRIVDRICEAIPGAIVDFDVTEGGRCVGLAFLSSGKYFATNNGPYYNNLDIPFDWSNMTSWCNVYVYPGPARAWVCRSTLDNDRWLPSVLFLCHYIPDAPRDSELLNLGSLMLGQNGIWGNLQVVPAEGRALFGSALAAYKEVRDAITAASPVRVGRIGASPEIHEKIAESGAGLCVLFANEGGEHAYVTEHAAGPVLWQSDNVEVTFDAKGRAILRVSIDQASAAIVIFGERK